jgi:membrane protease YdiL (CAAX protease family)
VKQPGPVPFEVFFKARQTVLMMIGFGILIAPLVEETMFRGFLYPVAARQFGVVPGVLFTGLLFGASHAQQLSGAWGQIALLVVVGIVLTAVRARTGSVLASFLLHVAYNTTLFAGLYLGSHGLRDFPIGK